MVLSTAGAGAGGQTAGGGRILRRVRGRRGRIRRGDRHVRDRRDRTRRRGGPCTHSASRGPSSPRSWAS